MKIYKFLAILSVAFFVSISVKAQRNYAKEAEKVYNNEEWTEAIEAYKKASSKVSNKAAKAECTFKVAECYRKLNDMKNAETWYAKAIKAKFPDPAATLLLAEAKKSQERYNDAIVDFNEYAKMVPSDPRGADGAKSCALAQKWKDNPTRYSVTLLPINSKGWDFAPTYADKKYNSIFFVSTREGAAGNKTDPSVGGSFSDIYEAKMDKKGSWSAPQTLGQPINTSFNEGPLTFNKKRSKMFFTRFKVEQKKQFGTRIMVAEKKGGGWTEPQQIPLCNDTVNYSVGHPAILPDESKLYFSSNMPGGFGGFDIWFVTYDKKGNKWGEPQNAGYIINTGADEYFPCISEKGDFYFASNGHLGMGGLDIYLAKKSGDNFTEVENLQYPLNSAGDDFGIIWEGTKGERGMLSSNRAGGKGGDDIYTFSLPPIIYNVDGFVSDVDTKAKIVGAKVKMVGSDGLSIETSTDGNGAYRFDMTPDGRRVINTQTTYTLTAEKVDYLGDKTEFTTVGLDAGTDFKKDMEMKPIKKEIPIQLPKILYDLAKWDLKPQFQDSLTGLIKTLNDNSNVSIELGSHTDTRGDLKSNAELAQKRAQSVVDFLISKGIAADRLSAKGYGESKPLVTDPEIAALKTDVEKDEAHQKNRRTDFRITSFTYVPKEDPNKKVDIEDDSE
jgi:peptidoglycan-associated lipoprotein